jgi:outer membrane murein-binding lipoprotein Lpp
MADASAEEKAKRVRSLLSAYYNSGAEDAPGRAGGRSAASIDSAAFDADAYISTLVRLRAQPPRLRGQGKGEARVRCSRPSLLQLKKTRLDQLHSKYTSMTSEIRALDSDMQARAPRRAAARTCGAVPYPALTRRATQMLVYENYSKFITATDTIRRMKDNVEEMGGRMDELQARGAAEARAFGAHAPPRTPRSPPSRPLRKPAST